MKSIKNSLQSIIKLMESRSNWRTGTGELVPDEPLLEDASKYAKLLDILEEKSDEQPKNRFLGVRVVSYCVYDSVNKVLIDDPQSYGFEREEPFNLDNLKDAKKAAAELNKAGLSYAEIRRTARKVQDGTYD